MQYAAKTIFSLLCWLHLIHVNKTFFSKHKLDNYLFVVFSYVRERHAFFVEIMRKSNNTQHASVQSMYQTYVRLELLSQHFHTGNRHRADRVWVSSEGESMECTGKSVAEPALLSRRRGHGELGHVELRPRGHGPQVIRPVPDVQREKRTSPLGIMHRRGRQQDHRSWQTITFRTLLGRQVVIQIFFGFFGFVSFTLFRIRVRQLLDDFQRRTRFQLHGGRHRDVLRFVYVRDETTYGHVLLVTSLPVREMRR